MRHTTGTRKSPGEKIVKHRHAGDTARAAKRIQALGVDIKAAV